MRPLTRLCLALGLASVPLGAQASLITLPGSYILDDTSADAPGRYQAPKAEERAPVAYIEYIGLTGDVSDALATLHVEMTLAGPAEGATHTVGILPLPSGTRADQVNVSINGHTPTSRFLDAKGANALYGQLGKALDSTRLLAYAGQPALLIPTLPLLRSQQIDIRMQLPVKGNGGLQALSAPLLHEGFTRAATQRLTVALKLKTDKPLKGVFSPSLPLQVKRQGTHEALLTANLRGVDGGSDLSLFFGADDDALGLRVLTHREEGEDQGYFMVLGQPAAEADSPRIPKDLVLAIDTSGSMRGEKWSQVQAAALEVLDRLNPGDRFNLIAFGDDVISLSDDALLEVNADGLKRAQGFLDGLTPTGRTNIAGALARGLALTKTDRPHILIFLTDGAPTAGERDPAKIVQMIPGLNKGRGRIFSFGVGHDVNTHLLDQMSSLTAGESHYVVEGEPIDVKMAALTDGLRRPVLTEAKVAWGGLEVEHTYPEMPTELFAGREVLMVGRYAGGGRYTVSISGKANEGQRSFSVTADFPKKAQPEHEFLAPLWAARRIGDLLHDLRLKGADAEKIAEVVKLSRRFGIYTEYTGFVAQAGGNINDADATAQATVLLEKANMQSSGAWAVRQADNEQSLRKRKVSSMTSNTYVDRRGNVQKAENLKQVGRRTFYKRDGRWVESAPAAKRPAKKRRVKRFSREYMDLVEQNKDFAKAQSLDGEIEINLGDEQVEVY
ncbi:MAG: VWA domain-containing protein [Bradymonadia bacterium]